MDDFFMLASWLRNFENSFAPGSCSISSHLLSKDFCCSGVSQTFTISLSGLGGKYSIFVRHEGDNDIFGTMEPYAK